MLLSNLPVIATVLTADAAFLIPAPIHFPVFGWRLFSFFRDCKVFSMRCLTHNFCPGAIGLLHLTQRPALTRRKFVLNRGCYESFYNLLLRRKKRLKFQGGLFSLTSWIFRSSLSP